LPSSAGRYGAIVVSVGSADDCGYRRNVRDGRQSAVASCPSKTRLALPSPCCLLTERAGRSTVQAVPGDIRRMRFAAPLRTRAVRNIRIQTDADAADEPDLTFLIRNAATGYPSRIGRVTKKNPLPWRRDRARDRCKRSLIGTIQAQQTRSPKPRRPFALGVEWGVARGHRTDNHAAAQAVPSHRPARDIVSPDFAADVEDVMSSCCQGPPLREAFAPRRPKSGMIN
jgi:hypothetical protein